MDRHLPRYHFQAPPWMNDPIPFYWEGDWHVFFQHNPAAANFGEMCWGHAVSRDLVRWQQLPLALVPSADGCDRRGCWTGSVMGAMGGFYLFYTAISGFQPELRQTQALATSEDLIRWEKYAGNPLIHGKPGGVPGGAGTCFRDPCVWPEAGGFAMVVGGEAADGTGGRLLLYRSEDLLRWRYIGVMYAGTRLTGHDFECPDLFELDGRWVLLTSRHRQWAHIGSRDGDELVAERVEPIEGARFYAGKTAADASGRRVLWGWVMEDGGLPGEPIDPALQERGWAGVLSLPRELYWTDDGRLGQRPVAELVALRQGPADVRDGLEGVGSAGAGGIRLEGVEGAQLELVVHAELPGDPDWLGLSVRENRAGCGEGGCQVRVGRGWVAGAGTAGGAGGPARVRRGAGTAVELRVFVDASVVEAFCDGAALTQRVYADAEDATGVSLLASEGARVSRVEVWRLG